MIVVVVKWIQMRLSVPKTEKKYCVRIVMMNTILPAVNVERKSQMTILLTEMVTLIVRNALRNIILCVLNAETQQAPMTHVRLPVEPICVQIVMIITAVAVNLVVNPCGMTIHIIVQMDILTANIVSMRGMEVVKVVAMSTIWKTCVIMRILDVVIVKDATHRGIQ